MFVWAVLKISVLLLLINKFVPSHADVISLCQEACDVISEQPNYYSGCLIKCLESLEHQYDQLREFSNTQIEDSQPEHFQDDSSDTKLSPRSDRAVRRTGFFNNNFVRYGRDEMKALRKGAQRRPNYIRVGRSGEDVDGDASSELSPMVNWKGQADYKRASRFIRIGKSGQGETASGEPGFDFRYEQIDKKNVRPSKYVRIGKRDDAAETENGH